MKRNIVRCLCPLLALILVFMSAAQPASAAEHSYIDLLNYGTASEDSNFFYFSDEYTFSLAMPYQSYVSYVDVTFTSLSALSGVSIYWSTTEYPLTLVSLGNNLYRAYGDIRFANYSEMKFTFYSDGSGTEYCSLLSARIYLYRAYYIDTKATVDISNNDGTSGTINFTGSTAGYTKTPTDVSLNNQFVSYIKFNPTSDWKKYDFWDVQLYMQVGDITSIAAVMGEHILPIEYNFINDTNISVSSYYVTVRVDLRDLLRSSTDYPMIMITGSYFTGVNRINIFNSAGSILIDTEENSVPVLQGIRSVLNSISSFISAQLPSIQNHLSSIGIALDNFKSDFSDYFEVMVDRLDILDDFRTFLSNIEGKIGEVRTTIVEYGHNIILAIQGDSSKTEELDQSSSQIRDDVSDVHQFEQDQQAVLDNNFTIIQNAVTVTSFAAALAFVQGYANHMFVGLGNVKLIFTLPLFLGLFFYVCSRIPGVTRWKSSPSSSGRSPTGTKASGKGGSSK